MARDAVTSVTLLARAVQCVLEGALAIQDVAIVAGVVALLSPYAGRAVINAGAVMFHGVTDDTLGRAAGLLGHRAEAEQLCGAALATYERIGACGGGTDWNRRHSQARAPRAMRSRRWSCTNSLVGCGWSARLDTRSACRTCADSITCAP